MLRVCELFGPTIQGEGQFAGQQSFFVRTTGCNLRCVFKDSICDTAYSSFNPDKPLYDSEEKLIEAFKELSKNNPRINHVVITGGEPLMQKDDLKEFLIDIFKIRKDWIITIETNGSLPIVDTLSKEYKIGLYSVSPKLSTSVDHECRFITKEQAEHHDKTRINYKNLFNVITSGIPYQFKFVYSGPECAQEIKDIYNNLSKFVNVGDQNELDYWMRKHPNKNTWLMPEGVNKEQLDEHGLPTVEAALANGWNYSDRIHIRLWNDKKGV